MAGNSVGVSGDDDCRVNKIFLKKRTELVRLCMQCGEMKEGTLWLVTDAGVTFYDRRNDLQSDVPPPIYISRVLVSGVEVNTDSSQEFAYDQNNISIDVIGLSLKDEKAVQYQYKLVGVDTGWSVPNTPSSYSICRVIAGNIHVYGARN